MHPAPPHPEEPARLALLRACEVLDSEPEAAFDELLALALGVSGFPAGAIVFVDETRQWFKSKVGLDATETSRDVAVCAHTILGPGGLRLSDVRLDPRFVDNPLVCGAPFLVAYCGIPLRVGPSKLPVGTLCVFDGVPHPVADATYALLEAAAAQIERLLEHRLARAELERRVATLHRDEEHLAAALNAMTEGMVVQRRDGEIVFCNPAAERILGMTADQMMGRTSLDPRWHAVREDGSPFPGQDHPTMVVLRTGQEVRDVLMGVRAGDGAARQIRIHATPVDREADGLPGRVVATFTDVTAAREKELMRRRAEAEVQLFFRTSLDMLLLLTPEGRVVRVNPAWTRVLGYAEREFIDRPILDFVHADDLERTRWELLRLRELGATTGFESRYVCRDGTLRTFSWVGAYSRDEDLFAVVARDVTDSRTRERELESAKLAAEAADRAKSEFLATMSHEIRTPMNGVIGLAELLAASSLDARQRELLDGIRRSGRALLDILNDILDWSRIEAGRLELERCDVPVRALVDDVVTLLGPQALAKGLALTVEVDPDAPTHAFVDAGRLRQVLFNVVGNALKFTTQGSVRVLLGVGLPGAVRVEVVDTGIGIEPTALARLFQRFQQADSTTTRRFGGSGLGLAISRALVEAMGGSMGIESAVGVGTHVFVDVPVGAEGRVTDVPPRDDFKVTGRRVLLVEDNTVNQMVAVAMLEQDEHVVVLAHDGVEAVAAFEREPFDVVLMDVQMPTMDGLEATRRIRALELVRGGRSPIVGVTASVMTDEAQRCLDAGMDDVVGKPVSLAALRRVLARSPVRAS